jgi:nitroimidazol reductase NimA-like FMN-containing flavoprotein (pyridoxamine 5'-phosphate oxidase superfamily)
MRVVTEPRDASSPRTRLGRKPERGSHGRAVIDAILDEGLVAHVGISVDGDPYVLPMVYGREGDRLFLHGSVASRLLRALDAGASVCVTVTIVDALVLARSQFHHSMNYRSVVVLGVARRIRDEATARRALRRIVDHAVPGRSLEARAPLEAELRQTMVLELTIDEASAKQRSGGPIEDPADLGRGSWGGLLPVTTVFGPPAPDGQDATTGTPASLVELREAPTGSRGAVRGTDRW